MYLPYYDAVSVDGLEGIQKTTMYLLQPVIFLNGVSLCS